MDLHHRAALEASGDQHAASGGDGSTGGGGTGGSAAGASAAECQAATAGWQRLITWRGLLVATLLGGCFTVITLKMNLGSAGMTPSLTIPGGLLSYLALQPLARAQAALLLRRGGGCGRRQPLPFTAQENAVVQTMVSACYQLAGFAGFGSHLLAQGYQSHLNTGGVPRGQPGFPADSVVDPSLRRIYPTLALISFGGLFALMGLRNLLILTWRLPFPSGATAGLMINGLHERHGAPGARHKARVLGLVALGSFLFDLFKWFFQGSSYTCGFAALPTFGAAASRWTWRFSFQQEYVGAGMLVPHVVAWSMMAGAVLSWGLLWPLLSAREGDWFPAGLDGSDMRGLGSYKVWLAVALLLGEGLYMLGRASLLGARRARALWRERRGAAPGAGAPLDLVPPAKAAADEEEGDEGSSTCKDADVLLGGDAERSSSSGRAKGAAGGHGGGGGGGACSSRGAGGAGAGSASVTASVTEPGGLAGVCFKESAEERAEREVVFRAGRVPWWLGPAGYAVCAVAGTIGLPLLYHQVRWYMAAAAFLAGPAAALVNAYGAGLTDQDNGANFSTVALFLFAAWGAAGASPGGAGGGGGVIAGCVAMGVVMVFAVNAAVLAEDFRTAYVTRTPPQALIAGQFLGTALGVLLSPAAFALFWSTGLVGQRLGPMPAPWADVTRGIALTGVKGASALPRHCGALAAGFLCAALLICLARDLLPPRAACWVPSSMAMSFSFFIGANNAISFWTGSLIVLALERLRPQAVEDAPLAGAGLIVGDGLWAVPSALLAVGGARPPVCLRVGGGGGGR